MHNKRGFFTQFIRHLVQLTAFILLPGLFITVFSAVRDILAAFMDGSFSVSELFPQIILVFMVFLITALWGRFFLWVSLFFWNAAGTYFLFFQTGYFRYSTDSGTV